MNAHFPRAVLRKLGYVDGPETIAVAHLVSFSTNFLLACDTLSLGNDLLVLA